MIADDNIIVEKIDLTPCLTFKEYTNGKTKSLYISGSKIPDTLQATRSFCLGSHKKSEFTINR